MKNPKIGQYVVIDNNYMLYQVIELHPKLKTAILRFIPSYTESPEVDWETKAYARYYELRSGLKLAVKQCLEQL